MRPEPTGNQASLAKKIKFNSYLLTLALKWGEKGEHVYKLSIEAELYGGENSRAVQKWHCFFLTSKLFCVPYVVMSSHPTCSLVWFHFLRVSHSLGQENTAKNTHLTVTG